MGENAVERIYLDHSATTPVRPEVFEAMAPYLRDQFGNAGSVHWFGRRARKAVDEAREQVAALIHAEAREIVFTSGGTESDNLAVRGMVAADTRPRPRVVTSTIEHHAVLHAAEYVRVHADTDVQLVPVGRAGRVDPEAVAELMTDQSALVSIMHANNETGVIQPIEAIAARCAERGICFHTDAVQSAGKIPIDVRAVPISLLAISGHKIYGPKGVGACYVRTGVELAPQAAGGAQERGRRAGTENVAGIVGLGKACELAQAEMAGEAARLTELRDTLEREILQRIPGAYTNGNAERRLPHLLNVSLHGLEGESIILGLDVEGIAVSSGSACTSGSLDPSHVLLAMGLTQAEAQSAVRFSLGRSTTPDQIGRVIEVLTSLVARLQNRTAAG